MLQTLVPETEEGKTVSVVVGLNRSDEWIDSVPAFLREHMLPAIPDDGKLHVVRITWTIGGI